MNFTLVTIVCPLENDTSERVSAMRLSCKIVNLDRRSTDRSNFKDDKFENSEVRIPLKSSLRRAHRVPFVTARTEACNGLLYLLYYNISQSNSKIKKTKKSKKVDIFVIKYISH